MEGILLNTLDNILKEVINNKKVFRKWFIVRSKWFTTFIQRGNQEEENDLKKKGENRDRDKNEKGIGRGKGFLKWWIKKNEVETDWTKKGWVYTLLCDTTGDWYIGSTKRSIEERLTEHLYEAGRVWMKDKMERTALHKTMWRTNQYNWKIVPLYQMTEEDQLRDLERYLIRKMKPSLNRQKRIDDRKRKKGKRNHPQRD